MSDLAFWDARYRQQARWTRAIRQDLLARAGVARARRLLDVGSGTGALTSDLLQAGPAQLIELDRDIASLRFTGAAARGGRRCQGLAERLPFAAGSFDVTVCHFLLLWVSDPCAVLCELRRVTAPAGAVLALAEPDYDGRMDWPAALAAAGRSQAESLARAGAHSSIGRRLRELFHAAGLREVRVSLLGGEWVDGAAGDDPVESDVLARDLAGTLPDAEIEALLRLEAQAERDQSRIRYVPTFSAIGFAP